MSVVCEVGEANKEHKVTKYRSTATYKRKNPVTGVVEATSRFHEGQYANRTACEAVLNDHVKLDEVVGKVSVHTKKVR